MGVVKAPCNRRTKIGSEKPDYRNLYGYVLYLFAGIVKNTNMGLSGTRERAGVSEAEAHMLYALTAGTPA